MNENTLNDGWRQTHLGRMLGHAMRKFDARVLELMAANEGVPLALANLAARDKISAAHIHITRHLSLQGTRLTELAQQAGMTKQAMGNLVNQCEAWGLVRKEHDPLDARAKQVCLRTRAEIGCVRLRWLCSRPRPSSANRWAGKLPRWWPSVWRHMRTRIRAIHTGDKHADPDCRR